MSKKTKIPPKKNALAEAKAQAVKDLTGMHQVLSQRPDAADLAKRTRHVLHEVKKI